MKSSFRKTSTRHLLSVEVTNNPQEQAHTCLPPNPHLAQQERFQRHLQLLRTTTRVNLPMVSFLVFRRITYVVQSSRVSNCVFLDWHSPRNLWRKTRPRIRRTRFRSKELLSACTSFLQAEPGHGRYNLDDSKGSKLSPFLASSSARVSASPELQFLIVLVFSMSPALDKPMNLFRYSRWDCLSNFETALLRTGPFHDRPTLDISSFCGQNQAFPTSRHITLRGDQSSMGST